ncbi:MAG: hypothetical protein HYT67_00195 [Candidatus Yanofskybacteria bacterium]|nr:hypothetical protein [Candidatus Yanofskybacteria bacterium]
MNLYKKITGLILVCSLLTIGSSDLYAQTQELPHFFPEGVTSTNVPVKQWQEWRRYYNATRHALADHEAIWPGFIHGKDVIVLDRSYFGQKVKLVFDNYICEGKITSKSCDGKIRYQSFDGQYYITERQFQVVAAKVDEFVPKAVKFNFGFWGKVESVAVAAAAKSEGKTEDEFRKVLDKNDPVNPGITFREQRHIPERLEEKDFIPYREIHFGLTPDYPQVLGVAWLNAGIIHYTPEAMIRDYLTQNTPLVLAHEFVHANKKLQSLPIGWGLDLETMASVPDMLFEDNHLDLWIHSYSTMFRELIWVFYGFRFEQAADEITKRPSWLSMGNTQYDEEKFNELSLKLNTAKKALQEAFLVVVGQHYSTPIFWTAVNDKVVDDNFVFRVMMSALYNPTLLGGEGPTMKWLEARGPRIKQMMDKAWEEAGTVPNEQMTMGNAEKDPGERRSLILFNHIRNGYEISDDDAQKFLRANKVSSLKELLTWEPARLRKAIESFIQSERATRRPQ